MSRATSNDAIGCGGDNDNDNASDTDNINNKISNNNNNSIKYSRLKGIENILQISGNNNNNKNKKQAEGYRHLAFLLFITRQSVFYSEFFETENTQINNTKNTHTRTHNEEKMKTTDKASIFNT